MAALLEQIETGSNAYINGFVDMFLFQLRTMWVLIFLAGLSFGLHQRFLGWLWLLASVVGAITTWRYHRELARFRQRRFRDPKPPKTDTVGELVREWCGREEVVPLKLVLPVWPPQETKAAYGALIDALDRVGLLDSHQVFLREREHAAKAIEDLRTKAQTLS